LISNAFLDHVTFRPYFRKYVRAASRHCNCLARTDIEGIAIMYRLCSAVIGAVILTVIGMAPTARADRAPPPPAPAYFERPVYSLWQGLYAGVHAGYGESGHADGFLVGAQIGYNWQASQIVYGLEADISWSDISASETIHFAGMWASARASVDWMGSVRGRLGILLEPRLLAYATAGFGFASASWDAGAGGFGMAVTTGGRETETGFVWGLGLEGKLSQTMSARIEYLGFSGLDRVDDGLGVIRAGLNFKLGQ
jgi:outer membrane immunogenic protein